MKIAALILLCALLAFSQASAPSVNTITTGVCLKAECTPLEITKQVFIVGSGFTPNRPVFIEAQTPAPVRIVSRSSASGLISVIFSAPKAGEYDVAVRQPGGSSVSIKVVVVTPTNDK